MTSSATASAPCAKCGYQRRPTDTEPTWQCPSCGIAYHKYQAYIARASEKVKPRPVAAGVPSIGADSSVWALVGVNVLAIFAAVIFDWQLVDLMAVYWLQSVVIGVSYYRRIMSLEKFSTENFTINNQAVDPTPETKRKTAAFFVMHFSIFHLGYLVFIFSDKGGALEPTLGLLGAGVAFAINHLYSYRYHLELDRQGTPNIGRMMFTPYVRVIPMHLAIVLGATTDGGLGGVLLFGAMKTVADVSMHIIEHTQMRKQTRG